MTLLASCHCGDVKIRLVRKPGRLTECNCSVCRRYGAQWAYGTAKTMQLDARPGSLRFYSWGDKCIEFYHCQRCGCLTHYESTDKSEDSRVAVNVRMLPAADVEGIPVRHFDGADSWQYLD